MKKHLLVALPVFVIAALAGFGAYRFHNAPADVEGAQFVNAPTLRQWLSTGKAIVVDVQTYDGYAQMHFPGSIPTHAYPVATAAQRKRVEAVVPLISRSEKPVVLVCFGGVTGAPNARLALLAKGVPNRRIFVLEGGTTGWPWKEMLEKGMRR